MVTYGKRAALAPARADNAQLLANGFMNGSRQCQCFLLEAALRQSSENRRAALGTGTVLALYVAASLVGQSAWQQMSHQPNGRHLASRIVTDLHRLRMKNES
jgi:hypothetical protein